MTSEQLKDAATLQTELAHYFGGEEIYKHLLNRKFCYTAGVRHFAQNAGQGAYWLLDIMATEPSIKKLVMDEGFVVVNLIVKEDRTAYLTVKKDSGAKPDFKRQIRFTDCPEGDWKFYIEPTYVGADLVMMMMLPQER